MLEGFIANLSSWLLSISGGSLIMVAVYAGVFVAVMTTLGALLAIFANRMPDWGVDVSLSFAAGVMIVASFTSLILPAIESTGTFTPAGIGILLGVILIYLIDRFIPPHEHLVKGYEGPKEFKEKLRVVWLIVLAVIIHNLPEGGMAVGTSLVYDLKTGLITAIAIGIQDFPEGTVVSLPLATLQKKRLMPIVMGALSGVAEMVMVILGAFLFTVFHSLLPTDLEWPAGGRCSTLQ